MADHVGAGDVSCSDALDNALQSFSLGEVDGQDAGTGILGANDACVSEVLGVDVVGVLAVAQDLFSNVQTMDAVADMPVLGGGTGDLAGSHDLACQLDSCDDLDIAGATAVVVAQSVLDLVLGRIGILVQQGLGAHDHAGDAEAALNSACLTVSIGEDVLLPLGQAFDSDDGLAFQAVGGGDTGLDSLAVDDDGTCAACALRAAILNGGQTQVVTQVTQQGLLLVGSTLDAVNSKSITHSGILLS